jgi:protein-S-isoprenylcysteine O-methyltransferase Ste14
MPSDRRPGHWGFMNMYVFLLPLLFGFGCSLASTFTTAFAQRWGPRVGVWVGVALRGVLGLPLWALGFALAVQTPAPWLAVPGLVTRLAGWALAAAGGAIILWALATLRGRAARPSVQDALAQTGLYARVRHPIHGGTLLEFAGLGLLCPTWPVALACGLGGLWVLGQTWLEERDLLQRLPDYRAYMQRVPRFIPRFGAKPQGE